MLGSASRAPRPLGAGGEGSRGGGDAEVGLEPPEAPGDFLPGARVSIAGVGAPQHLQGREAVLIERLESAQGDTMWRVRLVDGSGQDLVLAPSSFEACATWSASNPREQEPWVSSRPSGSARSKNADSMAPSSTKELLELEASGGDTRRTVVGRLLRSEACEACILAIIVLNFAMACLDADAGASGEEPASYVRPLLVVCYASIVLEFLVRVYVERRKVIESLWNWLDLLIIFSGFLEYVVQWSQWDLGGIGAFRALRICRVIRLARLVRRVKCFREFLKLLHLMGSCFRTLLWSFLVMSFVMLTWAAVAVEVIHPYVTELADVHGHWPECERCRRSFSSVMNATLTLFQTIVAGDSWGQVAIPVIEFKPWTAIVFVGALLTVIFGVLNLIVAVVIDVSAEVRAREVSCRGAELEYEGVDERRALVRMFEKLDLDGNRLLSYEELRAGEQDVAEFRHWLHTLNVNFADVYQLFQMSSERGASEMSLDEFLEAMSRMKNMETKTTTRFVRHLVTKLHGHQTVLEKQIETELGEVKLKVDGCESALWKGLSEVREDVSEKVLNQSSDEVHFRDDEALHQRIEEQMESMEAAFQQATREALEIALRTAADTTRHLLQAANMKNQRSSPKAVQLRVPGEDREPLHSREPPLRSEEAKASAGASAPADVRSFWPLSWWSESASPRGPVRLPSENSWVENPPAAPGAEKPIEDDSSPQPVLDVPEVEGGMDVEECEAAPEPPALAGGGSVGEAPCQAAPELPALAGGGSVGEAPCQELRGPQIALTGPPRPFLPEGFQPRGPFQPSPPLRPSESYGAAKAGARPPSQRPAKAKAKAGSEASAKAKAKAKASPGVSAKAKAKASAGGLS